MERLPKICDTISGYIEAHKAEYLSYPYLNENPYSLLGRKLPQVAQEAGCETRTFMPKFGEINERRNQLHEVIRLSGINLIISDSDHPLLIKVASIQSARIQIYFIDNDVYFDEDINLKGKGCTFKLYLCLYFKRLTK